MLLDKHARMQLAVALIARRTRVSIVHQETDIARDALRALYREMHGRSAPSGQLPAPGGAAITTRRGQLRATLFALLYRQFSPHGGSAGRACDAAKPIDAVIAAHDAGQALAGAANSLDMTGAWAIARDLRAGAARLLPCHRCTVLYLVADHSRFDRTCPVCALYRAYSDPPDVQAPIADAWVDALRHPGKRLRGSLLPPPAVQYGL
jgi:hypothetical protein